MNLAESAPLALAQTYLRSGELSQAEAIYRQMLAAEPDCAEAWQALGNFLTSQRRLDEAERSYREALRLGAADAPAILSNLGNVLKDRGLPDDAEVAYRDAIRLRPDFPEALTNLGNLLGDLGRRPEAEECCRAAIRLRPDLPEPHNNLGNLLRGMERLSEAEASCREALRLRPGYLSALNNLGNALRDQGRFAEAEQCYRDTVRLKPDYVEALNNLASLLYDQGRPDEAVPCYETALRLKPDYIDAHVNLALTLLLMGRFGEGWAEYEWRWKKRPDELHRGFAQPLWEGGETGDQVLLIHAEQGFGDTLQFCRFAVQAAIGRRVVLEVQRPLAALLRCLPGIEQVVAQGDPLPHFDLHCPLLSVPHRLGSTLETLPTAPYVAADPARIAAWRKRVESLEGLKVGLVWAGNPTMAADRRRSVRLDRLAPLGRIPGISFVSLQKGPAAAQAAQPPAGMALHDWTGELRDFADTAALIATLDLVIAVDTGVVHLAAALGKPVWLLNRYDRCWRWMLNRDDSPWYPSLRQFLQPEPGDWDGAVEAIRRALAEQAPSAPDAEIAQLFKAGLAHHKAGRRREAEAKYHAVLALAPDHADSLHLLGVAAQQVGKHQLALGYVGEAVAQEPANAAYRGNLGAVLKALGRFDEAESSYREALRLDAGQADVHCNLGNLLVDRGRPGEAEASYRAALVLQPGHRDAQAHLGNALAALGRAEAAMEAYRTGLARHPDHLIARLKLAGLLQGKQLHAEAEEHYRVALRLQPGAETMEKLADTLLALSRPAEAEPLYRQALEKMPGSTAIRVNLGNALKALKRLDEAETSYREALRLTPRSMPAEINLGTLLQELGRIEEATAHCQAALALAPDHPAVHLNLGNVLQDQEQWEAAERHIRDAVRLQPVFPEAHNNLGNLLRLRGRFQEAEASCRLAISQRPGYAAAHIGLGNALKDLGRPVEAESAYREALRHSPSDSAAHNNLGTVLLDLERPAEAEACYREALRLKPGFVDAYSNLGAVLVQLGRTDEAEAAYREALRLKPNHPEGHNNLAVLLHDLGRAEEAIDSNRAAISLRPDYAEAHVNLALTLLSIGRLDEAWPEYEWRWRMKKQAKHARGFKQPLWDGGATGDKVLLLHAEQGFGDTLQFCRYAALVASGRRVVLEAQRPLLPLLAGLPGVEKVVAHGDPLPDFDLHCPLLTLPLLLGTALDNIPGETPYLAADPAPVAAWRARLDGIEGLRVGLVWAGNPAMAADRRRSVALDRLAPFAAVPGVTFVSLQKGPAGKQAPPEGMRLLDWTDELKDFGDTAALIEALDLVVTVDTAVVHLAGALGKTVWLLNRFDPCWRWLRGRDDNPWYPNLRQFRQAEAGSWDAVIDRVRAALDHETQIKAQQNAPLGSS